MSANINSMMYVGEKPWHGQGTKLDQVATAAEALTAAKLDWKVNKEPLQTTGGILVPNHYATVREDTKQPLGVVGNVYRVLQNVSAFSFFDAIVGLKEAIYHTAGALGNGEVIWILAKVSGLIKTTSEDVSEKFLLLMNRHDGLSCVRMLFTPIRVVCQNTLNIALSDLKASARIKHCMTMGNKIDEVRNTLGIINTQFSMFETLSQKLAVTQLTREAFTNYLQNIGLQPTKEAYEKLDGRAKTMADKVIQEVTSLFEHGRGNDAQGVKGSAWAAFNGVTEYVDYVRTSRGEEDNRTKSLLLGSGATLKQKAWDQAVAILG